MSRTFVWCFRIVVWLLSLFSPSDHCRHGLHLTKLSLNIRWFLDGRDLELLDDDTKVVWASSPAPLPFVKPRDFVTVVNVRRLEDGSIVVVNRGYRHPAAPVSCFVDVDVAGGGASGCGDGCTRSACCC